MRNARRSSLVYVIDASVYAPLVTTCGRSLVKAVKELGFAILDLTVYEVCNAFWKECAKIRRIGEDDALHACRLSKALARYAKLYTVSDLDTEEVMKIALTNSITFYDSAYIALAIRLRAPIASEDADILSVAPRYGVEVVRLRELINAVERVTRGY